MRLRSGTPQLTRSPPPLSNKRGDHTFPNGLQPRWANQKHRHQLPNLRLMPPDSSGRWCEPNRWKTLPPMPLHFRNCRKLSDALNLTLAKNAASVTHLPISLARSSRAYVCLPSVTISAPIHGDLLENLPAKFSKGVSGSCPRRRLLDHFIRWTAFS